MRTYELLYIIPATLTDEEVARTEGEIQALIQKYGGTPKESRRLGKFKLTYLIKHARHGHYVLVNFEAEPQSVAKINEALRIAEKVVRHLILNAEEASGSFEMVQYQEILVEGSPKDDRSKRRRVEREKSESVSEDVKAAADLDKTNVEESKVAENAEPVVEEPEIKISSDELDRKIDAALTDHA